MSDFVPRKYPVPDFPPVELADEDGLLAIGGDLTVPSLVHAYGSGIFPWPVLTGKRAPITWFAPPMRAVLFLSQFEPNRSLKRAISKGGFTITFDRDFEQVITHCARAKNRPGQKGSWITPGMVAAYTELHRAGFAHSCEAWRNGELVGGVYGVALGGSFSAESMFHSVDDASKAALLSLVEHLRSQGAKWIDAQVINPFTESFGFREIPRAEFMKLLAEALEAPPLEFSKR